MRLLTFIFICLECISIQAQPLIDLCLAKADDHWLLVARPNDDFEGVFSNLQFSLKIEDAGAGINAISQSQEVAAYMPIQMAGTHVLYGSNSYQKFAGFGIQHMTNVPVSWEKDSLVALLKIFPSSMHTTISIVDDAWTSANFGNYYAELNGVEVTGSIFNNCPSTVAMVSVDGDEYSQRWQMYPNPASHQIGIESDYSHAISIRIRDQLGRLLMVEETHYSAGEYFLLNISELPVGVLFLEIEEPNRRLVYQILKK